jgi:hypothetical protein
VVEGDGLEIRCTACGTEGSNPSLSDTLDFFLTWRGVRAVEGARLESVCAKSTGGSNPPLSVSQSTDSELWVPTQPRQDRKVAAASGRPMRLRGFVGWVSFY